jgi:hypothetical protein
VEFKNSPTDKTFNENLKLTTNDNNDNSIRLYELNTEIAKFCNKIYDSIVTQTKIYQSKFEKVETEYLYDRIRINVEIKNDKEQKYEDHLVEFIFNYIYVFKLENTNDTPTYEYFNKDKSIHYSHYSRIFIFSILKNVEAYQTVVINGFYVRSIWYELSRIIELVCYKKNFGEVTNIYSNNCDFNNTEDIMIDKTYCRLKRILYCYIFMNRIFILTVLV